MRNSYILLVMACLLLLGIRSEASADVFTVVTSEELKAMIDRNEPGLVLVDTRSSGEYQEAHIKGAVSIPWSTLEKNPAVLDFPRESKILFYCTGSS